MGFSSDWGVILLSCDEQDSKSFDLGKLLQIHSNVFTWIGADEGDPIFSHADIVVFHFTLAMQWKKCRHTFHSVKFPVPKQLLAYSIHGQEP